ncbi:TetR family transcriptional regulator [Shewanella litorisediminis]|uniref:TetR family transcriptional regulator n=1 Tax=Shewanella litorisediminis TaxID=1173586 RepID=A0ABX7G5G1_9GAMM|nr:TetR family transcriptional regulator [Shewanella litorisediminis]MCL2918048.1 TetR family transcriptional regulator [Shewanella litorisediminis]QRH02478.1 TetR family transcriptional regulator [Shewanella litorisediminis]
MAKRSKVQTEQTINQIMDEALKQILSIGFDAMSYTTLSEATGISRTGISHHFPKKTDFLVRLDARIGRLFMAALDFSSVEALERSWMQAMRESHYRAVLKLFFSLCGSAERDVTLFRAISGARESAMLELGTQGERTINQLLGRAAVMLIAESDAGVASQAA